MAPLSIIPAANQDLKQAPLWENSSFRSVFDDQEDSTTRDLRAETENACSQYPKRNLFSHSVLQFFIMIMDNDAHKPQSIVHQLSRTPRAVSNGMRRCNVSLKRFSSRFGPSTHSDDMISSKVMLEDSIACIDKALEISSRTDITDSSSLSMSRSGSADFAPIKPMRRPSSDPSMSNWMDDGTTPSCHRNAVFLPVDVIPEKPVRPSSIQRNNLDEPSVLPLHTINQNDFMIQCLVDTSRPCLVHFFAEDSVVSDTLDRELGEVHAQSVQKSGSASGCRFLRMSVNSAPLITSKLHISPQDPSIVCLHNGQVFQRMMDPECYVQFRGAVKQWARDAGLLDL